MNLLESFIPKLFITLIPTTKGWILYSELRKGTTLIKEYEKIVVENIEQLEKKVKKLEGESTMHYVVLLDTTSSQGLFRECKDAAEIEISQIKTVCIEQKWGLYIDRDDLFEQQKQYKRVGLDLLFSPFSLLHHFYEEEISKNDGLYLLVTEQSLAFMVFRERALIFADLHKMKERLPIDDESSRRALFVSVIEEGVQRFYESQVASNMFIERLFIADSLNFDMHLENRLEEILFVETFKHSIDLSKVLVTLAQKELL